MLLQYDGATVLLPRTRIFLRSKAGGCHGGDGGAGARTPFVFCAYRLEREGAGGAGAGSKAICRTSKDLPYNKMFQYPFLLPIFLFCCRTQDASAPAGETRVGFDSRTLTYDTFWWQGRRHATLNIHVQVQTVYIPTFHFLPEILFILLFCISRWTCTNKFELSVFPCPFFPFCFFLMLLHHQSHKKPEPPTFPCPLTSDFFRAFASSWDAQFSPKHLYSPMFYFLSVVFDVFLHRQSMDMYWSEPLLIIWELINSDWHFV